MIFVVLYINMKAVVFVDVQKDFIDGALKNEQAIAVTPKIVEFAKQCAADPNCKLYATRDTHEKSDSLPESADGTIPEKHVGYLATLEGQKLPIEHCIEGTPGWMIDNRLMDVFFAGYVKDETCVEDTERLIYNCTFVNKPTFGSFDLAEIIYEDDIAAVNKHNYLQGALHCHKKTLLDEIVLCGFCTDVCVASNALLLRAKFPNTKITVMKDLCAGVTPETHEAALKTMRMCQIDVI